MNTVRSMLAPKTKGSGFLYRPTLPLQTKLTISQPGDQYEKEADAVAAQVMGFSGSQGERLLGLQQEKEIGTPSIQRTGNAVERGHPQTPLIVNDVLHTSGQPLDHSTLNFMETRFGHSFSNVRVHTDAQAAKSARAIQAKAYTVGTGIVFGEGQYSPTETRGRHLLAHELAHVVQQGGATTSQFIQRESDPPKFPNLPGLATQLSLDIHQNLFNNGHHFYRIATLHPDQPELLQDAFAQYALGTNVLETGFKFFGVGENAAPNLALGTGIAFKTFNFLNDGELAIDYQHDLGNGFKLEGSINLGVNPDNLTDVKKGQASVGLVGTF